MRHPWIIFILISTSQSLDKHDVNIHLNFSRERGYRRGGNAGKKALINRFGIISEFSLDGGCLRCGKPCLSAVESTMPACVGGAYADLSIPSVFLCVRGLMKALP